MEEKICVVGSVNMDYLVYADRFPNKSETMFGKSFHQRFGGKGANQAIASSRLGAKTSFIGAVGDDDNGLKLRENFIKNGVDVTALKVEDVNSGIAICTIAENTNHIIVVKGANEKVDKNHIDDNMKIIEDTDLIILQNEIDIQTTKYVAKIGKKLGKVVVLNPAPATKLDGELIEDATFIIPNEVEVMEIFSKPYKDYEEALKDYPNKLIVTYGSKGAYFNDNGKIIHLSAIKSEAVDTTGAGDCFIGSFSAEYLRTKDVIKAINFAMVSAGLKVRNKGAQSSIPTLDDVRRYIKEMES